MSIYGKNCLDYQNAILTEAYFGKTETLLEIEKKIGEIRKNCLNKYADINRSKEVLELNRLFEKQFGMEIFSLHIEKNDTINAYTIPVATKFDVAFNVNLAKSIVATQETGYRFKPGNNLCIICNIYMGLIKHPEFTDAEILAVILHELGHNFADGIYKRIGDANKQMTVYRKQLVIISIIYRALFTFGISLLTDIPAYRDNINKVNKKKESKTKQRKGRGIVSGIKAQCSDFVSFVNELVYRITPGNAENVERAKQNADSKGVPDKVKKSAGRMNEVVADKFAGIYGYGPEQASALVKMHKIPSKAEVYINDVLGGKYKSNSDKYNDACKDIYKYDEHPNVIQRINEEIKTLQYELEKSDLDPKLIEAMKKQLKELEDIKNQAMKVVKSAQEDEKNRAIFYKYINDKDPNAVDDEIEKEINDAFDDFLK